MATAKKQYLTVRDVCELLQVSRTTVWRLVQRGELRPIRLRATGSGKCSRVRFDPEEVERYMRRMSNAK